MMYKTLHTKTQEVYNRNAKAFDNQRSKSLFEQSWLERFSLFLPKSSTILDLGCGTGEPIAQYFIAQGHLLTGVDFSDEMLLIARKRFPAHRWLAQDIRSLSLADKFDGIIAWGSFFHLNPEEQREHFSLFYRYLRPLGVALVTVGPEFGEITGQVNHNLVYHSSLSFEEYERLGKEHNLRIIQHKLNDPDCQGHSILLLQKEAS